MDELLKWIANNPWFIFLMAFITAGVCILLEIFVFRKKALKKIEDNSYTMLDYYTAVRKRDIRTLIMYGGFLGLPSLVYLVLILIPNLDQTYQYVFWGYFFVVSIVLAFIRKDFILLFIWMIPTFTLFYKTHRAVDDGVYDVEVDANGKATVSEHFSFITILMGMLGFMLFLLKLIVLFIYLLIISIANIGLSLIGYPILYMVNIIKVSKEINALS